MTELAVPEQQFPALLQNNAVDHGFVLRIPGIEVQTDRSTALARLRERHSRVLLRVGARIVRQAAQVHGNDLALVTSASPAQTAGVDGLLTADPDVVLTIYVADCCAIYLIDPRRRVIGLLHSGKKGTALNISARAVEKLETEFGCDPADLIAQLSPCIRPPHYEIDFASEIMTQLRRAGVKSVHDCGENTGSDLNKFYSYRVEKGQTGRMMAYLALRVNR
jgi:copper oxidase (laccase) domain-containing protein